MQNKKYEIVKLYNTSPVIRTKCNGLKVFGVLDLFCVLWQVLVIYLAPAIVPSRVTFIFSLVYCLKKCSILC